VEVFIFTDAPELLTYLVKNHLPGYALAEMRSRLTHANGPALAYVDTASWTGTPESLVSSVAKMKHVFLGLIDSDGKVKNPIDLMHKGAVDYFSPQDLPHKLTKVRCNAVIGYIRKFRGDYQESFPKQRTVSPAEFDYTPVARGWKDVKIGKQYTFSIMFIELDEREEMEKRYGSKNLQNALQVFRKYIERNVAGFGGKFWIWSNYGGIILFPFDGPDCGAVICGFRIVMYKFLHDAEESHFPNFISFRMATHIGNLVYQEKSKGEVVSDSLNTVFHLGQEYAEPGNSYLTEDIFRYAPPAIKTYFKELGTFEDRLVYRLRMPIL
jgi:hypothetical protein